MSKSNVATAAEPIDEPIPPAPRKPPEIDPASVQIDVENYVLRQIVVRLPEDFVAADLAEPSIWRRVQMHGLRGRALRKLDRLVLISHDEGHLWEAWVSQAGPDYAVLARPVHYELQARRTEYFSDPLYRVAWAGAAFSVVRKSDGHVLQTGLANESLAIRALQSFYPRPV